MGEEILIKQGIDHFICTNYLKRGKYGEFDMGDDVVGGGCRKGKGSVKARRGEELASNFRILIGRRKRTRTFVGTEKK